MPRRFTLRELMLSPTTVAFNWAQFAAGLTGSVDAARTAGRFYGQAGGLTMWVGFIRGTDASVRATSDNGLAPGLVTVSIDGAASTVCPLENGRYTLFSGLIQAERLVCIAFGAAFYNIPYFTAALDPVLLVTGQSPSVDTPTAWVQPGDGSALTAWSSFLTGMPNNTAGYVPHDTPGSVYMVSGSNVASVRLRTQARKMLVSTIDQYVYVSVDGATPTRYYAPLGTGQLRPVVIPLDGALHTYNVWPDRARGQNCTFAVGVDAPLVDIGSKRRLDQYGDSITDGAGSTSSGDVETMGVAATLGMVGSAYGISGETITQLLTRLPTLLAGKTVSSDDVAIIAEGRNNTGGAFSAQVIADYTSIITALLAKGYGKVLCRGVLGSVVNGVSVYWPAENASIQAIVAAFNDPRVVFVDISSWQVTFSGNNGGVGIPMLDGTHPPDAGYAVMAPLAVAAYAPLI